LVVVYSISEKEKSPDSFGFFFFLLKHIAIEETIMLIIIPSIKNNKTIKREKARDNASFLLASTVNHTKRPLDTRIKAAVITIIRTVFVRFIYLLAKNNIKYGIDIKAHNTPLIDQKGTVPPVVIIDFSAMLNCNILLSNNPTIKIALVTQIKFFCESFICPPLIYSQTKLYTLLSYHVCGGLSIKNGV